MTYCHASAYHRIITEGPFPSGNILLPYNSVHNAYFSLLFQQAIFYFTVAFMYTLL